MKKSWFYCVMHFYCQFFTCITQVPSVAELVKSLFFTCFWLIFVYIVAVLSVGLVLSCPFLLTSLNKFILSLENALRSFACLTKGDVIAIKYNEKVSKKMIGDLICLSLVTFKYPFCSLRHIRQGHPTTIFGKIFVWKTI